MIHWSISYDGPRQPLIILKPTLDEIGCYQCSVRFFAVDAKGDIDYFDIGFDATGYDPFPFAVGLSNPDKKDFLIIAKNEVGKGTMAIEYSRVCATAKKKFPRKFQTFAPTRLFAQLILTLRGRGDSLNFDAWTGDLQTEWLEVPIGKL